MSPRDRSLEDACARLGVTYSALTVAEFGSFWDGKVLHGTHGVMDMPERPWHELGHWLTARRSHRKYPGWGLGDFAGDERTGWGPVLEPEPQPVEHAAHVVGLALWGYYIGLEAISSADFHDVDYFLRGMRRIRPHLRQRAETRLKAAGFPSLAVIGRKLQRAWWVQDKIEADKQTGRA